MREKFIDSVIGIAIALVVFVGAHLLAGCGQVPAGDGPAVIAAQQDPIVGTTMIAPTTGHADSASAVSSIDADGNVNFVGGNWVIPLPVTSGDRLGTFSAIVRDNGPSNGHTIDGNNVTMVLQSRPAGCSADTCLVWLTSVSTGGSGIQQTLTFSTSHVVVSGETMQVTYFALKRDATSSPATVPSMVGVLTVTKDSACPTPSTPPPGSVSKTLVTSASNFTGSGFIQQISPTSIRSTIGGTVTGAIPLNSGDVVVGFRYQLFSSGNQVTIVYKLTDGLMNERTLGTSTTYCVTGSWISVPIVIPQTSIPQDGVTSVVITALGPDVLIGNISIDLL